MELEEKVHQVLKLDHIRLVLDQKRLGVSGSPRADLPISRVLGLASGVSDRDVLGGFKRSGKTLQAVEKGGKSRTCLPTCRTSEAGLRGATYHNALSKLLVEELFGSPEA
jgi:hypothetical protein